MTTSTQPLAFRCSKCFQVRCSTVDRVGQPALCELCGHQNIVPEATEDRIAQGLEFLEQATSPEQDAIDYSTPSSDMTDAEIMAEARREMYENAEPSALVCSKLKRFLGAMVDGIITLVTILIGALLAAVIAPATGSADEPNFLSIAIVLGFPTMLGLIQMILVATEGRTLGKYCVSTKIVNAKGDVPGFFQGVFLRIFANALLGVIPLYGLIDAVVIFTNDANRCVHDFIAGTYVIDA